jgi:hypothetical protein
MLSQTGIPAVYSAQPPYKFHKPETDQCSLNTELIGIAQASVAQFDYRLLSRKAT